MEYNKIQNKNLRLFVFIYFIVMNCAKPVYKQLLPLYNTMNFGRRCITILNWPPYKLS